MSNKMTELLAIIDKSGAAYQESNTIGHEDHVVREPATSKAESALSTVLMRFLCL